MLVCFDATVLCGAIRKPTGQNFKLLELAADGAALNGFTTDVAGMEFVRNALDGLSGVVYDMSQIERSSIASRLCSTRTTLSRRRSDELCPRGLHSTTAQLARSYTS